MTEHEDLAAGRFSTWVEVTVRAHRERRGVDVPCGDCTACCRSSYFIHIGPDEMDTLRRIPKQLLFPAPGRSDGTVVLGYDEHGRCPMLVDGACSIYDDRPLTCRTYDCRVFAAAGVRADDDGKPLIAQRADRWRFDDRDDDGRAQHDAVRAAAAFLREHPECFAGSTPRTASELAVVALRVHDLFLGGTPTVEAVTRAVVES